jgi:isocitrate dehydrogenase
LVAFRWNGITISRDTIHIEGVKLGFEKIVLFDRHAVGGEYGAGWRSVGKGRLVTTFFPDDGSSPVICDDRVLKDDNNVVVTYHNPLDNVKVMMMMTLRCPTVVGHTQ